MRNDDDRALTVHEVKTLAASVGSGLKTVAKKLEAQAAESSSWLDGYTAWLMSWLVNFPNKTTIVLIGKFAKDIQTASQKEQLTTTEWLALKKRGEDLIKQWKAEPKSWVSDCMLHDLEAVTVEVIGALNDKQAGRALTERDAEARRLDAEARRLEGIVEGLEEAIETLNTEITSLKSKAEIYKNSISRSKGVNEAQSALIKTLESSLEEATEKRNRLEEDYKAYMTRAAAVVKRLGGRN